MPARGAQRENEIKREKDRSRSHEAECAFSKSRRRTDAGSELKKIKIKINNRWAYCTPRNLCYVIYDLDEYFLSISISKEFYCSLEEFYGLFSSPLIIKKLHAHMVRKVHFLASRVYRVSRRAIFELYMVDVQLIAL